VELGIVLLLLGGFTLLDLGFDKATALVEVGAIESPALFMRRVCSSLGKNGEQGRGWRRLFRARHGRS